MPRTYDDFVLEFEESESGVRSVSVVRSSAGECTVPYAFPFDSAALELQLKDLQIALLRSGGNRRRVLQPEEKTVQSFGAALYDSVFTGEVRSLLEQSRRNAADAGNGLRLRLRFNSAQLASLPWEFIFDQRIGDFVALATDTPIVRHLALTGANDPLAIEPPLRILGMIASPANLPPIDLRAEQAVVERSLRGLIEQGTVDLQWVQGQGWRNLRQRIREEPWHVIHFMGHGAFDATAREGIVYFADENGQADAISAVELNRILSGNRSLRLVLLNSCLGGGGDGQDVFSSTAATLVRGGIPAVIAMQFEITDDAATEFARTFYDAVVDGLPVDAAVDEGRRAISVGIANSLEWGIPVLYMRSTDGRVFDVGKSAQRTQPPKPAAKETPVEPTPQTKTPEPDSTKLIPVPVPLPNADKGKTESTPAPSPAPDVSPVSSTGKSTGKPLETTTAVPTPRGLRGWRLFFFVAIGTVVIVGLIMAWGAWGQSRRNQALSAGQTATAETLLTVIDPAETLAASAPMADPDQDGLRNELEVERYASDPNDADSDDDGVWDGDEAEAGTNPLKPDTDDDFRTDYQELNADGTDPTRQDTDFDGGSDGLEFDLGTDPTKPDTDGDGLTDHEEVAETSTDPTVADTDGDGVSDYDEVRVWNTDPLAFNSVAEATPEITSASATQTAVWLSGDSDGDSLKNGEEIEYGTDPEKYDSDGDNLTDGLEVMLGVSDPTKADTDGDALRDDMEEDYLTEPNNPDWDGDTLLDGHELFRYKTDPTKADTDGDGMLDGDEVRSGTDPLEPDSTPATTATITATPTPSITPDIRVTPGAVRTLGSLTNPVLRLTPAITPALIKATPATATPKP